MTGRQLRVYEDEGLVGELVGAELEQNARGWRIKFKRGRHGHGDRVMSLGYALMAALDTPGGVTGDQARMSTARVTHDGGANWCRAATGTPSGMVGGRIPYVSADNQVRWARPAPAARSGPHPPLG